MASRICPTVAMLREARRRELVSLSVRRFFWTGAGGAKGWFRLASWEVTWLIIRPQGRERGIWLLGREVSVLRAA
jgi:hypothetical protein